MSPKTTFPVVQAARTASPLGRAIADVKAFVRGLEPGSTLPLVKLLKEEFLETNSNGQLVLDQADQKQLRTLLHQLTPTARQETSLAMRRIARSLRNLGAEHPASEALEELANGGIDSAGRAAARAADAGDFLPITAKNSVPPSAPPQTGPGFFGKLFSRFL